MKTVANGLTDRELVEKANLALDGMGLMASDKLTGTKFVAAKKLRNGGMVLKMDSELAADWLKKKDVRGLIHRKLWGISTD